MNSLILDKKKDVVSEIKNKLDGCSLLVFCNYCGTSVDKLTELRRKLYIKHAEAKVYKNTLAKLALKEYNIDFPEQVLQQPTLVISTQEDIVSITKLIKQVSEEYETISIKGGVLEKRYIQSGEILEVSKLPSKQELLQKVVQNMNAPIVGLVNQLAHPIRGLITVLNSIKEKKEELK